jgi:protein phosphatase
MADQDRNETAEIPTGPDRDEASRGTSVPLHVEAAARTHTGKVRTNNEDHYFVARVARSLHTVTTNLPEGDIPLRFDTEGYVLVVADGMGGAAAGEVASRMAITTLVNTILEVPDWIMKLDEENARRVMDRWSQYYRRVDRALTDHAQNDPNLTGMGTTMTVVYSVESDLCVAHVGDSRFYLYRKGSLQQLTRDHTQAQALVDAGMLRRDDVATSRLKHVLIHALGVGDPTFDVEMQRLRLQPGDRILLCSDGLTDMVDDASLARILAEPHEPERLCADLVEAALERGGRDNVTVIVAEYTGVETLVDDGDTLSD